MSVMIKGVIFDMDGVLVDSTPVHIAAFKMFCDNYGITDWEQKLSTAYGMGNDDIMRLIIPEEIIQNKGFEALADEKEAIYRKIYAPTIKPIAGLVELLSKLNKRGIKCAVGSSGCKANVDFVLEKCGIVDYFDLAINGDMVGHCKPDPEIYLTAARDLGFAPSECLIFEDAKAGLEAARRAGAGRIIALATTLPRTILETESGIHDIIDDYTSVLDIDRLLSLQ